MDRGDDKIAPLMADLEKSDKPTLRKAVDALIRIAADDPQIGQLSANCSTIRAVRIVGPSRTYWLAFPHRLNPAFRC